MTNQASLFDAKAAWSRLTPDQQAEVGIAAIIGTVGAIGCYQGRAPMQGFHAAAGAGEAAQIATLSEALGDLAELPRPDLSILGVTACRMCGCTDQCACPSGCSWAEPDLCSRCAETLAQLRGKDLAALFAASASVEGWTAGDQLALLQGFTASLGGVAFSGPPIAEDAAAALVGRLLSKIERQGLAPAFVAYLVQRMAGEA